MANDIELYQNSDIAPYSEPLSPLAPLSPSPDSWGRTDVDILTPREVDQHQRQSGQMLFGQPMPAGTTNQQINATLGEIGGVYLSDFSKLGYPSHLIQSAIQFFMDNATRAPQQVRRQHSFSLPKDLSGDWLAESFGNHLDRLSGTQASKQQFLNATLQWLNKLSQHISGSTSQTPRTAPTSSGTNDLDDATYNALYDYNEKMKPRTEAMLRAKFGDSYHVNLRMVDEYLQSLSSVEKAHFDRFLNNGLHALNDPTVIMGLYHQAIGAGSIPRSGSALQDEINACQALMKSNPKQWRSNERLQARYRYMLDLQR